MGITYDYQFHSILCWLLGINKGVTMKTIDVKSMLIGFLLCACFFLTIGATDEVESMQWNVDGKVIVEDVEGNLIIDSNNGRYQLSTCTNKTYVEETIIDTRLRLQLRRSQQYYF